MDLKAKLQRVVGEIKHPTPQRTTVSVELVLPGREIENAYGRCYCMQSHHDQHEEHAGIRYSQALQISPDVLEFIGGEAAENISIKQALFFDTETTGLAGGTGTWPFLVGLGRFAQEGFVVRQFLMRDYNEELALLEAIRQELASARTLVSFNGKAFDKQLLQTRFSLARMAFPDLPHLDLLHMGRRLWKTYLDSCSLVSLERNILGFHRNGDVPGAEIPQRYFDFLRTGDPVLLQDVVHHNKLDILSMVGLLCRIEDSSRLQPQDCHHSWEAESLGSLYLQRGQLEMAALYLARGVELCPDWSTRGRLLARLGFAYKRLGRFELAEGIWRLMVREGREDVGCYEELAKHYEHRTRDYAAALTAARRGLALAFRACPPKVPQLQHRIGRLQKRIAH